MIKKIALKETLSEMEKLTINYVITYVKVLGNALAEGHFCEYLQTNKVSWANNLFWWKNNPSLPSPVMACFKMVFLTYLL